MSTFYEGKETIFFDKTQIAASLAICLILPLLPKERPKGFPKGNPLWSLPGKVGGLGEGKTTHRKSSVFLPPNSLPALQS